MYLIVGLGNPEKQYEKTSAPAQLKSDLEYEELINEEV